MENNTDFIFTARCPKCKGVVMASVLPIATDRQSKKELIDLIQKGCSTQTEPNGLKYDWHDHKTCDHFEQFDKKKQQNTLF